MSKFRFRLPTLIISFVSLILFTQNLAAELKPGKYEVRLVKSQMIPMRDGVRLSTDLYFPQKAGEKLPVILIRTPYNKESYRDKEKRPRAYMFASHGFVVAVQDCRGKFESEGIYSPPAGHVAMTQWIGWQNSPGVMARLALLAVLTHRKFKLPRLL